MNENNKRIKLQSIRIENTAQKEESEESLEDAKQILEPKIDARTCFLQKDKKTCAVNFRELTPLDNKKIKKINNDEMKILKIHSNLNEQENVFRNTLSDKFDLLEHPKLLQTKLLPYQLYGVSWMYSREQSNVKGGILADEMGMGKTLQALGLILSYKPSGITLIVVPAVAIGQWQREIETHAPNVFEVVIYHCRLKKEQLDKQKKVEGNVCKNATISIHDRHVGDYKIENFDKSLMFSDNSKYHVILTTYGTVGSEMRRKDGLLFKTKFFRIILDEAHYIKDIRTNVCSSVSNLDSEYRWGLTGTPVQNRVGDLYSLVRFLRLDPHSYYFCKKCDCKSLKWLNYDLHDEFTSNGFCTCGHFGASHFSWWNRRISKPIKDFGFTTKGKEIFNNLNKIISHIILRRTKQGLEKELGLPSKIVTVIRNYFSEAEKEFYTGLYQKSKNKFMTYAIKGEINANYANILELLQKMRSACDHPFLAQKHLNEGIPICGICNEEANDPIISKCKHIFCREEAKIHLESSNRCPICKIKITIDLNQEEEFVVKKTVIQPNDWISSTKVECLIEELTMQKSKEGIVKNIVFSQYVKFLEILRWRLERAGFKCVHIFGSMSMQQRKIAIETFNSDSDVTVFLISLKAGGVALNLTEATHVYLMDLWWNPAVEEQAMDRIHRIGQHRPIRISKVIMQDSIESRILILQEKKKALFDSAVDNDTTALEKLTEEDLHFLFK
ncbi:DNA repair protein rad16 [Binucleata daphniae]